jgi:hypothetical protein
MGNVKVLNIHYIKMTEAELLPSFFLFFALVAAQF